RLLYTSALILIATAALTLLYAHDARLVRASHAQKQDNQKLPSENVDPSQKRKPVLIAKPPRITLCPGRPTQVKLAALRMPAAFSTAWDSNNVGKITETGETTALWDL